MLAYGNKEFRNLQEQVLKNTQDIEGLFQAGGVLDEFGIKVIGKVASIELLPDVDEYKFDINPDKWEYGDTYAVGTEAPYDLYILTRAPQGEGSNDYWLNIGEFPAPGPEGPEGPRGEKGDRGEAGQGVMGGIGAPPPNYTSIPEYKDSIYINLSNGDIYKLEWPNDEGGYWNKYGNLQGPAGPKGDPGPQGQTGPQGVPGAQGPRGDVGGFINIQGHLNSSTELPNPSTITDRTWAYLVGDNNDLYVQIPTTPGAETFFWENFGELNLGTYVTSGGEFQNVWDADSKLDKFDSSTTANEYLYGTDDDGGQKMFRVDALNVSGAVPLRDGNGNIAVSLNPTNNNSAASKKYVDDAIAAGSGGGDYLPLAGGTMTTDAHIDFGSDKTYITGNKSNIKIFAKNEYTAGNPARYSFEQSGFQPGEDNKFNLGTQYAGYWKNFYLKGTLSDGTNELTIAEIKNGLTHSVPLHSYYNTIVPTDVTTEWYSIQLPTVSTYGIPANVKSKGGIHFYNFNTNDYAISTDSAIDGLASYITEAKSGINYTLKDGSISSIGNISGAVSSTTAITTEAYSINMSYYTPNNVNTQASIAVGRGLSIIRTNNETINPVYGKAAFGQFNVAQGRRHTSSW